MLHLFTYFCCVFAMAYAGLRILNGADTEEGEFPYAVSIKVSLRLGKSHLCGGTILNDKYILTAAHCVCRNDQPYNSSFFSIQYDLLTITEEPVNTVQVKKIHMLPFSEETWTNDVAVLELESSIPAGKWKPVKIAKTFSTEKKQKGIIIGWGRVDQNETQAKSLQKLNVDVYDDETCKNWNWYGSYYGYDDQHHICVGAKVGSACRGDSGSALVVDGIQVGIASFSEKNYSCILANEEHPNAFSRISTYYEWIKSISE